MGLQEHLVSVALGQTIWLVPILVKYMILQNKMHTKPLRENPLDPAYGERIMLGTESYSYLTHIL